MTSFFTFSSAVRHCCGAAQLVNCMVPSFQNILLLWFQQSNDISRVDGRIFTVHQFNSSVRKLPEVLNWICRKTELKNLDILVFKLHLHKVNKVKYRQKIRCYGLKKFLHCTVVVHIASCTELLARLRAGLVVVVSQHRCSITAKELGRSKGRVAQGRAGKTWTQERQALALLCQCGLTAFFRLHQQLVYIRGPRGSTKQH